MRGHSSPLERVLVFTVTVTRPEQDCDVCRLDRTPQARRPIADNRALKQFRDLRSDAIGRGTDRLRHDPGRGGEASLRPLRFRFDRKPVGVAVLNASWRSGVLSIASNTSLTNASSSGTARKLTEIARAHRLPAEGVDEPGGFVEDATSASRKP